MTFFLADGDKELKGKLEKLLGFSGFMVGDKYNFFDVRCIITEPSIAIYGEDEDNLEKYNFSLNANRKLGVPVVFYSDCLEETLKENGFCKKEHYDVYFSKEKDSLERVAAFVGSYLGNNFFDSIN
jgi:hypothetical protein